MLRCNVLWSLTTSLPSRAVSRFRYTVVPKLTRAGGRARADIWRILERHGYTVTEAREGRDALTVAAQYGGRIDLLLTDVVMPEMGG